MTGSGTQSRGSFVVERSLLWAAALVLIAVGFGAASLGGSRSHRSAGALWAGAPRSATIDVERFEVTEPAPGAASYVALSDSIATRLARVPRLEVRIASARPDPPPDFRLIGDISVRDGRLVIATQLFAGRGPPVWTATFWRTDKPNSNLADDIAADVAEAIVTHAVRGVISTDREQP